MADVTVTHPFVSGKADGADATLVQPSNWNDGHTLGAGTKGDLLARDTAAADGASWIASVATGQVLVSAGAGALPAYTASPTLSNLSLVTTGQIKSAASAGNTYSLTARDVDGGSETALLTFTANNDPTVTLPVGLVITDGAPSTTTNKLYQVGGAVYFNGAAIGGGGTGHVGGGANTSGWTTAGTTIETLATVTLPAATLNTNGGKLEIWALYRSAANTNSKTITLALGSTNIYAQSAASNAQSWYVRVVVVRISNTSWISFGYGNRANTAVNENSHTAGTDDLSGALDITFKGTTPTSAGDITLYSYHVQCVD